MKFYSKITAIGLGLSLSGCAWLHHVSIGDIDNRSQSGSDFDIKVSETGVNIDELAEVAKVFAATSDAENISEAQQYIQYFQMGPRTGNPVYNENYAYGLYDMLYKECPSGKISNLTVIRETNKYPVVSGEIIRIKGNCQKLAGNQSTKKKHQKKSRKRKKA